MSEEKLKELEALSAKAGDPIDISSEEGTRFMAELVVWFRSGGAELVRDGERLLRAAQEIRLDFASLSPEEQSKWIHLPEFRAAIDAARKEKIL
jgi:hypothetical protein